MIRRAVLQLNASYEPLRIISAKKALTLITKGVALVEVPTSIQVHQGIFLPSVIRLRNYRHVPIRLQVVSRRNIILRDGSRCQYCGDRFESSELTLDHVIPRSRGGRNEWSNLVAACKKDNHRKADRTPEEAGMKLLRRPLPQTIHTPRFLLRSLGLEVNEWGPYLYQDSEGDKRFSFAN
jgi:5-methylcytosine-specific restriction endonuclease McrA